MKISIKKALIAISILFLIAGTFGVVVGISVTTAQILLATGAVLYLISTQIRDNKHE